MDTVIKFLNNQMHRTDKVNNRFQVTRADLDAAHPLPSKDGKPSLTIVKFHDREIRDLVIKNRRQLKSRKISITDDLTRMNQQLLSKLRASSGIEAAWSWNGKVFAQTKGNNKVKEFVPYDPIPKGLSCARTFCPWTTKLIK